jgi:predicted transcriptional regulator
MNTNVKVKITAEDATALERRAEQDDRSVSAVIRLAIRAYLQREEGQA